jgi:hypothetical protein
VLRDAGLAEPEVFDQLADGPLALAEQVQDLPAGGLGECGEGGADGDLYYQAVI